MRVCGWLNSMIADRRENHARCKMQNVKSGRGWIASSINHWPRLRFFVVSHLQSDLRYFPRKPAGGW